MTFSKTEKNILNQNGFTLVELMVVVAIIGLLSAVAIPNFQKYQARSKTAEAKLQLAAIYTAEQSFYADYNIYLTCLKYMGYDPTDEGNSRYYTMGFSSTDTVDPGAYTSAQNSGLAAGECPSTLAGAGNGHYLGLKKVASSPATLAHHVSSGVGRSFVGTQAAEATQTFTAGAAGVVHKKFVSATDSSYMTIDEDKVIRIIRNGF